MHAVNHQFRLAARPQGMVGREHFDYVEEPLPELADGQVLVKTAYISLDPAMRGWMAEGRSYIPPVQIGEVMRAGTVGEVRRVQGPEARRRRPGHRLARRAGVRGVRRERGLQSRCRRDPADHLSGSTGHAGCDRLLRPARRGRPQRGRDGRRLRRRRRCRQRRRADRQNQGLSCGGHRRADRTSAAGSSRSSASTPRSTTRARTSARRCASTAPRAIDVYFDNVGGEILDAALGALGARRARGRSAERSPSTTT